MVKPACRQAGRFPVEYYLYIIYNPDIKQFYTGITNDINRRLNEHQRRRSKNVVLVYCEVCMNRMNARKREMYFKSGSGREIRNEIFGYSMFKY